MIATFETREQVTKIIETKKHLRKTNEYQSVYIDPYLSQSELSAQASFRTLLKEIGKKDVYHVHGSKLFPRNRRTETSGRGHGRDQRGDDSRQSHDPSGGSRHQGNLPYVRSPESGRRGQRLRDGRSTSIDRSHGSLPELGRRGQRLRAGRSPSHDRSH